MPKIEAEAQDLLRGMLEKNYRIQCQQDGMRVRVFWVDPANLEIRDITGRVARATGTKCREREGSFWLYFNGGNYSPVHATAERITEELKLEKEVPYWKF